MGIAPALPSNLCRTEVYRMSVWSVQERSQSKYKRRLHMLLSIGVQNTLGQIANRNDNICQTTIYGQSNTYHFIRLSTDPVVKRLTLNVIVPI